MRKFDALANLLNKINRDEEGLFDFTLEYDTDTKLYTIIDSTEEFYYDGYAFDRIYDLIDSKVKELFGDSAYIDCECPGRWVVAD